MLTGVDSPGALLERARALGLPALALTDVDGLSGLVEFLQAAQVQRAAAAEEAAHTDGQSLPTRPAVRPIVGAEISDPQQLMRLEDPGVRSAARGRLIALVETEQGYRNLCRLVSARHLGADPGEVGESVSGPEDFDRVQAAARWQQGLFFLVDHPDLLLELFGRVPAERLFVAISPASLALESRRSGRTGGELRDRRAERGTSRNVHVREQGGEDVSLHERADADPLVHSDEELQHKIPAPAQPVPALALIEAARAVGVATLAVPDVYWSAPSGEESHRIRVAIKHNALLDDLPDEWTAAQPAHLFGSAELAALFAGLPDVPGPFREEGRHSTETDLPGALRRTTQLAERCRYVPPLDRVLFPEVELEEGETPYSRLCDLAFTGARRRYRPLRPEVLRRLDYELTTIQELGFAAYFLLVDQLARFAKDEAIPCVGRGSAADSLVAYCLGLTDADPFHYRLPFERFLNPARRDRPDIDLDFCWRRRDDVLDHVYELFGYERTAMISTLNRFGQRSAFREAALACGIPPAEVNIWSSRLPMYATLHADDDDDVEYDDDVSAQVFDGTAGTGGRRAPSATHATKGAIDTPPVPPQQPPPLPPAHPALRPVRTDTDDLDHSLRDNPVAHALRATPEARDFPFEDARFQRALAAAATLLDAPRHYGLHPGGVVVAPGRITDLAPCQRATKGCIVTQFDKDAVEAIGLVKMDLLGNRALTVIDDCLRILGENGVEIDVEHIPEDDGETARTLREGRTLGCFQIESPGMRNLLQQSGAADMNAVIQAVALIRPGPASSGMKDAYVRRFRGLEDPTPPHPRLVDVLWDTHGVMLYQEDVMQAAARVAGMDLAEADQLRRALQKRRKDDLVRLYERFVQGAVADGVEEEAANAVWELISNFASFAFCKAHAVTYGRIGYRAAWLKTHYPAVFLTAFLRSQTGYYKQRVYVEEARRLGVRILGPDVNQSEESFTVEWTPARESSCATSLRVGLGQIAGLSDRTLDTILTSREEHGSYLSLPDFLERTGARTDEARHLIQCGAFDAFDRTRPELLLRLHLLRTPQKRVPRRPDAPSLDAAELEACRSRPDAVDLARDQGQGWRGRGLGVAAARLEPGESVPLFPTPVPSAPALPALPDPGPLERGRLEFELLGVSIDMHPIRLFPCEADERITESTSHAVTGSTRSNGPVNPTPCARIADFRGGRVTLRGWPAATRRVRTSRGELMRFLTLEDESGLAEVVIFPDVYRRDGANLAGLGVRCVTGVVEDSMGACTLHAERVW